MWNWEWIVSSAEAPLMSLVSLVGIYLTLVVLVRLMGLRSFSKISGFDFPITVAIGSALATVVLTKDPPLLLGVCGVAMLFAVQMLVAWLRVRSPWMCGAIDNEPLLLMNGPEVLHDNLRKVQLTEADLRAKLREANVLTLGQVRAVVMESTGDVTVLHGEEGGVELEPWLLKGVRDRPNEELSATSLAAQS